MEKVEKTEQQWREELTPEQYEVLRNKATERPFSGRYVETKEDAIIMWANDVDTPAYAERLATLDATIPGTTRYEAL